MNKSIKINIEILHDIYNQFEILPSMKARSMFSLVWQCTRRSYYLVIKRKFIQYKGKDNIAHAHEYLVKLVPNGCRKKGFRADEMTKDSLSLSPRRDVSMARSNPAAL